MILDTILFKENDTSKILHLNTFESEPTKEKGSLELKDAINEYFQFDIEQQSYLNAYYSIKFDTFVLPVFHPTGKKNFVFLKNNSIININNLSGYHSALPAEPQVFLVADLNDLGEEKNFVLVINPDQHLIQFFKNSKLEKRFKTKNYTDKLFYFKYLIYNKPNLSFDEINSILKVDSFDINVKNSLEYLIQDNIILYANNIIIKVDPLNIDNLILAIDTLI